MHTDKHGFRAALFAHRRSEPTVLCNCLVSVSIGVHPWLNCVFQGKPPRRIGQAGVSHNPKPYRCRRLSTQRRKEAKAQMGTSAVRGIIVKGMEFQFCPPAFIPLPNIPLTDVPQAGASCRAAYSGVAATRLYAAAVRIPLCQLCVLASLRLCVGFRMHSSGQATGPPRGIVPPAFGSVSVTPIPRGETPHRRNGRSKARYHWLTYSPSHSRSPEAAKTHRTLLSFEPRLPAWKNPLQPGGRRIGKTARNQ